MVMDPKSPFRNGPNAEREKRLLSLANTLRKGVRIWSEVWPNQEMSKAALAIYLDALQDIPEEDLAKACREVIKTCALFPKPADIRRAYEKSKQVDTVFSGPPALDYSADALTPEERAAACEEFSGKVRAALSQPEPFRNPDGSHTERCLCHQCRRRRNLG